MSVEENELIDVTEAGRELCSNLTAGQVVLYKGEKLIFVKHDFLPSMGNFNLINLGVITLVSTEKEIKVAYDRP